jgi:transposase InsO family protein
MFCQFCGNCSHYFLLSSVDTFSRYIVHHKLLISLDGKSIATELQAALEMVQGAKPRVVHDHGGEFVYRDVTAVFKAHNHYLIDINIKPRLPTGRSSRRTCEANSCGPHES